MLANTQSPRAALEGLILTQRAPLWVKERIRILKEIHCCQPSMPKCKWMAKTKIVVECNPFLGIGKGQFKLWVSQKWRRKKDNLSVFVWLLKIKCQQKKPNRVLEQHSLLLNWVIKIIIILLMVSLTSINIMLKRSRLFWKRNRKIKWF